MANGSERMSEVCLVTVGDMTEKFEKQLILLTNLELDALAYLCAVYKEEPGEEDECTCHGEMECDYCTGNGDEE